jgi:hypothetical protein
MNCIPLNPNAFKSIQIFCGEGGEGTLSLSAFIFKQLGSGDWVGAPIFPPHSLGDFDGMNIGIILHRAYL